MSRKTKVHIFTGGKGGVGKTLIALCASVYFLERQQKVLLVDLNVFNPDLYLVLKRLASENTLQQLKTELNREVDNNRDIFCQDGFILIPIENNGLLVVPDFRDNRHYQLPMGIAGFYNDYMNKIFNIKNVKEHNTEICVVDTGFHVANLALPGNDASENSWLGQKNGNGKVDNLLKNNTLNIWFLWTLGSWERKEELDAIESAIHQIDQIGIGEFEKDGDSLIHVFNPYQLYPEPSLVEYIFRPAHPLRKMAYDDQIGATITLGVMTKTIPEVIREKQKRGRIDRESYPRIIARELRRFNSEYRPKNFFPFLTYPHLKNYLVDLSSDVNPTSLNHLKKTLKKPLGLIARYLAHY